MSDIQPDIDPPVSYTAATTAVTSTLVCTNISYTMTHTTTTSPLTPVFDSSAADSSLSLEQQTVLAWLQKELSVYIELRLLTLQDLVCSVTSFRYNKSSSSSNDHRRLSDTPITPPPTTTTTNTSITSILYLLAHHYFPDHTALIIPTSTTASATIINVDLKVLDQVYLLFQDQFQITTAISDLQHHHPTFIDYILSIKTSVDRAKEQSSLDAASKEEINAFINKLNEQEMLLRKIWNHEQQQEQDFTILYQSFQEEKKNYCNVLQQQTQMNRFTLATRLSTIDTFYYVLNQRGVDCQQGLVQAAGTEILDKDPNLANDIDIAYLLNELEFIQTKMLKATVTTKDSIEDLKQNSHRINRAMEQLKKDYTDASAIIDQTELQQYATLIQKHHLVSGWVEEVLVWFVEAERISHWIEERIEIVEAQMKEQKSIHLVRHAAIDIFEFDCTESQISAWNDQHRQLVAEVDRFDEEDMTRLRAHVKQLTNIEQQSHQKDLSPADTTTIEITLTTLTTLDRLMYLLRRQEYELQLFTLRQSWEHTLPTAMTWVQQALANTVEFINVNARWKEEEEVSRKEVAIQKLIKLEQEIAAFDTGTFSTVVEQYQALDDACPVDLPGHLEKRQVDLEEKFELITVLASLARQLVEQHLAVADFLDRACLLTDEGVTLQNKLRAYLEADNDEKEMQYKVPLLKNTDILDHFSSQVSIFQEHVIRLLTSSTSTIAYPEATAVISPPLDEREQTIANDKIRTIVDKQKSTLLELSDFLQALLIDLKNQQLHLQKRAQKWHAEVARLYKWGEERLKLLEKFDKDIMAKTIDFQSGVKGVIDWKDLTRYKKENDGQLLKLSQIRNKEYQRLKEQMNLLNIQAVAITPLNEMLKKVEQALQLHEQKLNLLTCWMQWESQYCDLSKWLFETTLELWNFTSQEAQWRPNSTSDINFIQHTCEQFKTKINTFYMKEFSSIQQQFLSIVPLFDVAQRKTCAHIQTRQATLKQSMTNLMGLITYSQQVVEQHKALLAVTEKIDELAYTGKELMDEMRQPLRTVTVVDKDVPSQFKTKIDQFSDSITQLWIEQQKKGSSLYIPYPDCEKDTWATRPSTTGDKMSLDVAAALKAFHERLQTLVHQLTIMLQHLTLVIQYRNHVTAWLTETGRIVTTIHQWTAEIDSYKFEIERDSITYLPYGEGKNDDQSISLTQDECSRQIETVWNQQYLKEALIMLAQEDDALQSTDTLYQTVRDNTANDIHRTLQQQFETAWQNVHQAHDNLLIRIDERTNDFQNYCCERYYRQQRDLVIGLLDQVRARQPKITDSTLVIQPKHFKEEEAEFEKLYQQFTGFDPFVDQKAFQTFTESYRQLISCLHKQQQTHPSSNDSEKAREKTIQLELEYNSVVNDWDEARGTVDNGFYTLNSLKTWFRLYSELFSLEHDIAGFIEQFSQKKGCDDDNFDKEFLLLGECVAQLSALDDSVNQFVADLNDDPSMCLLIDGNKDKFSEEYARVKTLLGEAERLVKQKEEQMKLEKDRLACQSLVTDLLRQIEFAINTIKQRNQQHQDDLSTFLTASILEDPDTLIPTMEQTYRLFTTDHSTNRDMHRNLHVQAASNLLFKRIENVPFHTAALEDMKFQLKDVLSKLDTALSDSSAMHQWLRQVISHQKSGKEILTWMDGCRAEMRKVESQQEAGNRRLELILKKIEEFRPTMRSFEELAENISCSASSTTKNESDIMELIIKPKTVEISSAWMSIQKDLEELKKRAFINKNMALLQRLCDDSNTFIEILPLPRLAEVRNMLQQVNNDLFVMANMPRQAEIEDIQRHLKSVAFELQKQSGQLFEQLESVITVDAEEQKGYQRLKQETSSLTAAIQEKQTLINNYFSMCPFLALADEILLLLTALKEAIDQADTTSSASRAKLIELDKRFEYYEREILQQFNHARRQYRTSSSNTVNHNIDDMAHQLTEIFMKELEQQWENMKKRCKKKKIELSRSIDSNALSMNHAATAARSRKTSMPTTRMQHMTSPTLSSSSSSSSLQTTATSSSTHRRHLFKPSQPPSLKSISSSLSSSQRQHNASKSALPARKRLTSATSLSPPTTATSMSTTSSNTGQRKKSSPPPPPPPKRINSYVADPDNDLDMEIGRIINDTPYLVSVKMVPGEVGRYWFGNVNPKLCYCRVLKSKMVMVRVGGGWTELSQFLRDHALLEGDFQPIHHNSTNKKQHHQFPVPSSSSSSYDRHFDTYNQHRENKPYYEQVFQEGFIETRRQHQRHPSQQSQQSDDHADSISQFLNDSAINKKQVTSKRSFYNNKGFQQGYKEGDKFITIDSFGNQHEVQMRRALSPNQHFMKKSHSSTTTSSVLPTNTSSTSGDSSFLSSSSYTEERLAKRKLKKQLQQQQQKNSVFIDDEKEETIDGISAAFSSLKVDKSFVNNDNK